MKTEKISLANIQGKLSRNEMKNIMAGSGGGGTCYDGSGGCLTGNACQIDGVDGFCLHISNQGHCNCGTIG